MWTNWNNFFNNVCLLISQKKGKEKGQIPLISVKVAEEVSTEAFEKPNGIQVRTNIPTK